MMNPPRQVPSRMLPPGAERTALVVACEQAASVTDHTDIEALAVHPHREVRRVLAQRSDLTAAIYRTLAKDDDWRVRQQLLLKQQPLPDDVFRQLAEDERWIVRKTVPRNRRCPADIVENLTTDPNPWVRQATVLSRQTSPEALRRLADDPSAQVRAGFAHRQTIERMRQKLGL